MSTKTDFTPEEWKALLQAPLSTSLYISLSSFAMGDMFKESYALADKTAGLAKSGTATGLLADIVNEFKDTNTVKASQPKFETKDIAAAKAQLMESIRAAVTILDAKGGDDAAVVKKWLYEVADATANAAKEGDFMGIGGKKVNDAEAAALKELAGVLGVQA